MNRQPEPCCNIYVKGDNISHDNESDNLDYYYSAALVYIALFLLFYKDTRVSFSTLILIMVILFRWLCGAMPASAADSGSICRRWPPVRL